MINKLDKAVKLKATSADPAELRDLFVAEMLDQNGLIKIRRWQGDWYRYANGRFNRITDEEVTTSVTATIEASGYSHITRAVVKNVIGMLMVPCMISSELECHRYIATPTGDRLSGEIICFNDSYASIEMLEHGDAIPSTPAFFNLNATDFNFVPRSQAPKPNRWLEFLDQVCPDREQQRTLQQWFGYCLTRSIKQEKILFALGPSRSGKGTTAKILTKLIGTKNVAGAKLSQLSEKFGVSGLVGRQLAIFGDVRFDPRNHHTVTERLLSLSSGDGVQVERKTRDLEDMKLPIKLMLLSNEIPQLRDQTGALAGRFIILEFPQSFYGRENLDLEAELTDELPSIFWWAFDGLLDLNESGPLHQSTRSLELHSQMRSVTSPLSVFVSDRCDTDDSESWSTCEALYMVYSDWCKDQGIKNPQHRIRFIQDLISATGCKPKRQRCDGKQVRGLTGIAVV